MKGREENRRRSVFRARETIDVVCIYCTQASLSDDGQETARYTFWDEDREHVVDLEGTEILRDRNNSLI